jgi:hypothetical protein
MAGRKSLDQSLADKFIYGAKEEKIEQAVEKDLDFAPLDTIADKVQQEPKVKESTKRFTVDLPTSLHKRFSVAAIELEKDKAEIIRQLIEEFLSKQ